MKQEKDNTSKQHEKRIKTGGKLAQGSGDGVYHDAGFLKKSGGG